MVIIAVLHLTFTSGKSYYPTTRTPTFMKQSFLFLISLICFFSLQAQPKIKDKKYPSLLWEISGNGLKKPSYLIGTMHVSSKLAFHLPDSFYIAIRNADIVALETNPETWQEDMSKYDLSGSGYSFDEGMYGNYMSTPNDYLSINTLKFYKYHSKVERSLFSNPSTINNLLYRSYGNEASDFEEDTYLDMYIFQCGKKWGKKVTGVENYGESMKLMAEAYKDAAKDKNKKERSYDGADEYSADKLQEAYRNGNLDLLDSINKYNSFSPAFDEKFLYRRNEIQAASMDSIIKSGSRLFVGVGAAHLPGDRGVIEMLRKKGYKLRPVKMGERDSRDKELIDKLRVPVIFHTESADDGFFRVDIPGKFYKFGEDAALEQKQYADMSNGSYYMVTRIMTNAWMWGHTTVDVARVIDSLLYENVPGKIISKTNISRNGYGGFDIVNRTRRGDLQRYNIFITPFEVIFFKMSGNGDYVKNGDEAKKFFGSIVFKEYKNGNDPAATAWKKYSPAYGGFAIDMPHEPYTGNDGSRIYDAEDKSEGNHYRVIRTDIHNYHFVEEDTFDLGLMNESFMASEFIDTQLLRKQTTYKGYPALDCKFKDKNGSVYCTRFIIQGPHYYTLVAHGKKETAAMSNFLNSFEIRPFVYGNSKQQKDTSLYFSVNTPVFPEDKKIKLDLPRFGYFTGDDSEEEKENDLLEAGAYRNKVISNDTTGEKIYVSFSRMHRYYYTKDSAALDKDNETSFFADSSWIFKLKRKTELPNKIKVWEAIVTDSGSSRALWTKAFYKDGIGFAIGTQIDTLTKPSAFLTNFFETFSPVDTLKGINPFEKKSKLFFDDLASKDTVLHKRAVSHISEIELDSSDLTRLKAAINSLSWKEKKYLDTKKSLIRKLDNVSTNTSAFYLKELYYALDDTVQLQYTALESLLQHRTAYAYNSFREIISNEPPVLELGYSAPDYSIYPPMSALRGRKSYSFDNGNFLDELSDSLKLTKMILPDLLPLLNLDDYKNNIMNLLGKMVDSGLVTTKDYDIYFSKFLIEAKQELKKQSIAEKKKAIEKAEESKEEKKPSYYPDIAEADDNGNDDLNLYATLLLPFWQSSPAVQPLIRQMLGSNDKRLKYNTMLLLLQHEKSFPDTLLTYFAGLEDYRYELLTDLKKIKKADRFPAAFNNHLDLGRSALMDQTSYDKPDTLVYIDRLHAEYAGKKGFIYFYKYKLKKDDLSWKLAVVGLTPEDPKQFEYEDTVSSPFRGLDFSYFSVAEYNRYDFTDFTETKIETDEPLDKQLQKELKKLLYSRRKSAKQFYEDSEDRTTAPSYID
ncbi:MAG: TraB/GumN family protein [Sphingobacteriales bacterium]|nr:TraB/GumN family protein [Sphingobacteriales bacterium]